MRNAVPRIVLTVLAAWLMLSGILVPGVRAQSSPGWTEPQAISTSDEHGSQPVLAADSRGVVHAFWSAKPINREGAPWAIAYSYLDGETWSRPAEILLSPNNRDALSPRALIDNGGRMHLVWSAPGTGPFGPLYYSSAPADKAASPRAWQPAMMLADGTYQSDLRLASNGTLHLVYASVLDSAGICHRASSDHGQTWSEESCIQRGYSLRDDEHEVQPRLAIDSQNVLHVTWMLDDYSSLSKLAYESRAVYYARSPDGGQNWSVPFAVDIVDGRDPAYQGRQPAWANVVIDEKDRVHIVYVGAPDMKRYHTYSEDGGVTWRARQVAIASGGYNGWQGLAVDSDGTLWLIWPSLNGLEYATWRDDAWGAARPVAEKAKVGGAHYAQAAVALGNRLYVVWQDHGGDLTSTKAGHILYASVMTGAEADEPKPLPTAVTTSHSTPSVTTIAALRTPAAANELTFGAGEVPRSGDAPGVALALGLLPAFLIVAAVFVWRVLRR